MSVIIPPIKSQGIKTKLVPWINDLVAQAGLSSNANWIEPFLGTGVVGFNSPLNGRSIVGDSNPHIINLYTQIQQGIVNSHSVRIYLERESQFLRSAADDGYAHFRFVRDRFNQEGSPYDFIFLSRAGFNGMMRFNRKGEWNIPFCKKAERFSKAYISKICNQVAAIAQIIKSKDWEFRHSSFIDTIKEAKEGDIIYCDPPYLGRYVDYYNGWTEEDEKNLFLALSQSPAKFILSTWHHSNYRENEMLSKYWSDFHIATKEHFYHSGAKIENRQAITEALIYNFDLCPRDEALIYRERELFA